jgi:hypothetical protein
MVTIPCTTSIVYIHTQYHLWQRGLNSCSNMTTNVPATTGLPFQ